MTPDKQAAPSEWVERGVELADEGVKDAMNACTDAADALRAHLESKEREHLAARALVEQLAEALKELSYACTDKAEAMARAALAAYEQEKKR